MTSPPQLKSAATPPKLSTDAAKVSQKEDDHPRLRPPARSNFDLEPNPFEHSFSSTSANSANTSNNADKPQSKGNSGQDSDMKTADAATGGQENNDSKPMLPPLASIESPAFASWGLGSSLRSGPLSPAMLAGPASQQTPSLGLAFDSSFVRTGLTPDVSRTGLTPLIGGSGFPPPSPNTAALFALVNGTSGSNGAPLSNNVAITPNTLRAITGVLNQSLNPIPGQSSLTLDASNQHMSLSFDDAQQQQQQGGAAGISGGQQHEYGNFSNQDPASHALTNAASALYLLSQQNLQRQNQGQVAPSAVTGQNDTTMVSPTSISPTTRRGSKRKSMDTPSAPATRGTKKAKAGNGTVTTNNGRAAKRRASKMEDEEEEDDEDDDDDDLYEEGMAPQANSVARTTSTGSGGRGGSASSKRPETEEEKRKNFLERNRQAALKCRQRKKAWLTALQAKVEFLQSENERLTNALISSREEIARLSSSVVAQQGGKQESISFDNSAESSPIGSTNNIPKVSNNVHVNGTTASSTVVNNQPTAQMASAVPPATGSPLVTGMGGHPHGHHRVPSAPNGVTVGGRSYGY